jgi:hypothetical protein
VNQHNDLHVSQSASVQRRTDGLMPVAQARSCIDRAAPQHEPVVSNDPDFSRIILEASADCITVLSLDGLLLFVNENSRWLMEIDDCSEVKGQSWVEFWPNDQRPAVQRAMEAPEASGGLPDTGLQPREGQRGGT